MSEATINHCVIDVMFTCECGEALVLIAREDREVCRGCGKVWGIEVNLVDVLEMESEDDA